MSVEVQSLDGNSYPVQLYSDISAEWASGDRSNAVLKWSSANTGSSIYHEIQLQNHPQTVETDNQAQDGTVYYAMSTSQSGISWQIDRNDTVRNGFQSNGKLADTASNTFVATSPADSLFALAVNLGIIQSTASPVVWSVGYVRDPAITYSGPGGAVQLRRPYYATQYKSTEYAIDAFTGDYAGAYSRAVALDQKIMSTATTISLQYSDVIVALATRQVMATLDFTVGTDSNNTIIPGDVKIFMKNLGTDNRVNPVEHIYAVFPMFLYLNASIAGALLEPLLEVQAGLIDRSFAAMDIGNTYPTALGSEAVPQQGVEQSGNMLIMQLAYVRISGDGVFLSQYYNTTKRWADYLVSNALLPPNQTNQDGDTTDLANTALKGIIGVKAMAEIAHALGEDSDATEYGNQASSLFNSWLSLATSSSGSRLLGGYGNQQSWSLMYNLFVDKMLGLNFVPQSVINMQTQYLKSLLATEASQWGLPIDSESQQDSNTAWTMFASAFVSDDTVRDALIETIYNHANSNVSLKVFPEIYNIRDNSYLRGFAGPALGGVFSHLALTVPNKTISRVSATGNSQQSANPAKSSSKVSPIVGGVIGGVAIVCVVVAIIAILLRKKRALKHTPDMDTVEIQPHPTLSSSNQNPSSGIRSLDTTAGSSGIGGDSMETYNSTTIPLLLDRPPMKAQREAGLRETQQFAPSEGATAASNVGSQTASAWTRDMASTRNSISTTDVVGLRMEVENLWQVMRDIRAERLESPPEYAE